MLPQLAQGPGNTFWVIPSEVTSALHSVSTAFTEALPQSPASRDTAPADTTLSDTVVEDATSDATRATEAAAQAAADASEPSGTPRVTQMNHAGQFEG